MTAPFTKADSVREYHSGAASDGASQPNPSLCLGGYRAVDLADSKSIEVAATVKNLYVGSVSGANLVGKGALISLDGVSVKWQAPGSDLPGPAHVFSLGQAGTAVVEGSDANQFLRVIGTPPFSLGTQIVTLRNVQENVFGFGIVPNATASAGISQYRATVLRNVSQSDVTLLKRWIDQLGTQAVSDIAQLGSSGSGTIQSHYSLMDWPQSGWCQIRNVGTLREVVYYTSRTSYALIVPAAGRALLGSSASAGAGTDTIHAVPGIAIALSIVGVQSPGAVMATIANQTTAPSSVTWNLEITSVLGLQVARLMPGQQIGVWMWRHIPAGAVYDPNVYNKTKTSFLAN